MHTIKHFVFQGGGIWGIAYLGVLDYLNEHHKLHAMKKVAGTSAGAITACITSFNLPFQDIKDIANSLDYKKVPEKGPFGDKGCMYRLLTKYGWYSTDYFYKWMQTQIANQFDESKKKPPYTFADFKDNTIHKDERPFHDLYVVGTNDSKHMSTIFCYENTPNMEVAQAVRISISIPFFFESVAIPNTPKVKEPTNTYYSDGGVVENYPISLFNNPKDLKHTLGFIFNSKYRPKPIGSILHFIENIFFTSLTPQKLLYLNNKDIMDRTIQINTDTISPLNFNVRTHDETYTFLYNAGYQAAQAYFKHTEKKHQVR